MVSRMVHWLQCSLTRFLPSPQNNNAISKLFLMTYIVGTCIRNQFPQRAQALKTLKMSLSPWNSLSLNQEWNLWSIKEISSCLWGIVRAEIDGFKWDSSYNAQSVPKSGFQTRLVSFNIWNVQGSNSLTKNWRHGSCICSTINSWGWAMFACPKSVDGAHTFSQDWQCMSIDFSRVLQQKHSHAFSSFVTN